MTTTTKMISVDWIGNKAAEDLLMWKDPKASGITLAVCTGAYFLLEKSGYSLISIVCNFLLVLTCTAFLWAHGASFMNRGAPPIPKLDVSDAQIKAVAVSVAAGLNSFSGLAHDVATGKDALLSAKVAGGLFMASKVGGCFNFLTLVYVVVAILFTVPKVYEMKQAEIDKYAALGMEEASKYYGMAKAKVQAHMPVGKGPAYPAKPAAATKKEE